jgi:hypothetical protein
MATITILPLLMFFLGIPAAIWACVQVYNHFFNQPVPVATDGTPVSYKKTKALTWTTEVKVIEKK